MKRKSALLGVVTICSWVAMSVCDELTRDPATGRTAVSENVLLGVLALLLAVATAVAVYRGLSVPAALLVVPLASGATIMGTFVLALLRDESDGQLALVPLFAVVYTLLLVPYVGAVAGLTLAVRNAIGRRSAPHGQ